MARERYVDLTFLPILDREQSLAEIDAAMGRIGVAGSRVRGVTCAQIAGGGGGATRICIVDAGFY